MTDLSPRFLACLPFVLKEEGGYSNTPGDHGGATNFGIIQAEYNSYRHFAGLPVQSVKLIAKDEYEAIYWASYWNPHCPDLPPGLDLSFFNIAVNGGPVRAVKILQQATGVSVDGVWGPITKAAVAGIADVEAALVRFHDYERSFYQAIINANPSQQKFASDWFGRNDRCEKASLAMVQSVDGTS